MYDAWFRQQLTSLQGAEFGKLNQSLYSTTFLAYRGRGGAVGGGGALWGEGARCGGRGRAVGGGAGRCMTLAL